MTEKISQLVDNELDPVQREKLFSQIMDNKAEIEAWKCYHLIGNVMRDEISSAGRDLSILVAEKLNSEPTVLAPSSITESRDSKTTDIWKSAGLFAVAASLVLVAVVSLNPLDQEGSSDRDNQIISAVDSSDTIRFSEEFNEMLVEHGEFTASPGLNGLMAYAKFVSDQGLDQ
jgi:negative regulator of sigma E activity